MFSLLRNRNDFFQQGLYRNNGSVDDVFESSFLMSVTYLLILAKLQGIFDQGHLSRGKQNWLEVR